MLFISFYRLQLLDIEKQLLILSEYPKYMTRSKFSMQAQKALKNIEIVLYTDLSSLFNG